MKTIDMLPHQRCVPVHAMDRSEWGEEGQSCLLTFKLSFVEIIAFVILFVVIDCSLPVVKFVCSFVVVKLANLLRQDSGILRTKVVLRARRGGGERETLVVAFVTTNSQSLLGIFSFAHSPLSAGASISSFST